MSVVGRRYAKALLDLIVITHNRIVFGNKGVGIAFKA